MIRHPHANEEGYVRYPNIDVTAEMTNVMVAQKCTKQIQVY